MQSRRTDHFPKTFPNNYRTFFNKVDNLVFILNKKGEILEINDVVHNRLGYTNEELVGLSILEVCQGMSDFKISEITEHLLNPTKDNALLQMLTSEHEVIQVQFETVLEQWDEQEVIFLIGKEYTGPNSTSDKFLTNLKVKENEEILNKIFEHAPVMMMLVNKNSEIVKLNRTFSEEKPNGMDLSYNYNCNNVFGCISESESAIGDVNSELCNNCLIKSTLKNTIASGEETFKKEADIISINGTEISLRTYQISSSLIEKSDTPLVLLTFDDITERKRIEKELISSKEKSVYNEKRYRLLSDLAFEGIMLHQDRKIIDVNKSLLKMTGYSYAEFIGQDSMSFIFPVKYENYFKEKMLEERSLPYETEIIDKMGKRFPVEIESRYFKQNDQRIRVSAIRDITDRKEGEKKILQAVMNTEENERARFAQELHDGLGPILSNVQMYFQWLADEDENKQFVVEKGNLSLKNAFSTLREISNNLSPHILRNLGLVQALNNFIETVVTKNIRFDFKTDIETKRFDNDIETSLYRIVTELVSNTLRHSKASKISLNLHQTNDQLKLLYTDNGTGFDMDNIKKNSKGFGMINIRNRIKSIQGTISIKSKHNKGVKVTISIPVK